MKKWFFPSLFIAVIIALINIYFSPPPYEVFRIDGALKNMGERMKSMFPQGLPTHVLFSNSVKDRIVSNINSDNEVTYELMSGGYNLYDSNFENAQMKYALFGRRVVCWRQVFSLKGYYYVILFSDWTTQITKNKPTSQQTNPRANQ